jgi:hypothetical protein
MKSHIKIALESFEYFQNDGKLDADELKKLMDIALLDNEIDDDEKTILLEVIKRIKPEDIDDALQLQLDKLLPLLD